MKKLGYIIAAGMLFCMTAIAGTPETFKYQALVRNDDGTVLANRQISVRIKIHQGSETGDILFSETHAATTSQAGIAYINIGGENTETTLSDLNWANGPYFMEVEIDKGAGFVNAGTQQLMSVPYAQYAANAEKITLTSPDGRKWEVKIDNNGNLSAQEAE